MELSNTLQNNLIQSNIDIEKGQNTFLNSTMGKIINMGLNTGIRTLLPNIIEDQVIEIKDAILQNGFKAGIKEAINSAIDLGKSVQGIITGKFENISQARNAIKTGGIIDSVSELLNLAVNKSVKNNLIPNSIGSIIKKGKNVILETIETNIENNFNNQLKSLEYLSKYENNWREYYKNQDFVGMEREYGKIKTILKNMLPIEQTIKEARQIENIHLLIKNRGQDFNLTKEELELSKKLVG